MVQTQSFRSRIQTKNRDVKNGSEISEIGIKIKAELGENIRPAGEDIQRGETVVESGIEMTPGFIGVAASLGRTDVKAIRKTSNRHRLYW